MYDALFQRQTVNDHIQKTSHDAAEGEKNRRPKMKRHAQERQVPDGIIGHSSNESPAILF
jgi:hypothetical protein